MKHFCAISRMIWLSIPLWACACGPTIHFFTVDEQTITSDDSVKLNWSVRGKPTLLVHVDSAVSGEDEDHPEYREFTLVAQKSGKEKKQAIQIIVLSVESRDDIVFTTVRRGDTLIATGEKDTLRWGHHFKLKTVSSGSGRMLIARHCERTDVLNADGTSSGAFAGLANSGPWELRSMLSAAEKQDTTMIPGRLILHTVIIHQKY